MRLGFAPVLRWVGRWGQGTEWARVIATTPRRDAVSVLTVAVRAGGGALPVAWHGVPAHPPGAGSAPSGQLLAQVAPAVPPDWTGLVMTDRGVGRRRWRRAIRAHGWHPVMRGRGDAPSAPPGPRRRPAAPLVPAPGHAGVGAGPAVTHAVGRRQGTWRVTGPADQDAPWLVVTDLPPAAVRPGWDGMRRWVERGFRAVKGAAGSGSTPSAPIPTGWPGPGWSSPWR